MLPSFLFEHQPCLSHFSPQGITLYLKIDTLYMWQSLWLSLPTTNDHMHLHSSPPHTHTHTHTHTPIPPFHSCLILPPPSLGFPDGSASKESTCNVGDTGDSHSLVGGKIPGEGNGNPFQYSCLENPMDRGAGLQSMGSQRAGHDWSDSMQAA